MTKGSEYSNGSVNCACAATLSKVCLKVPEATRGGISGIRGGIHESEVV